MRRQEGVLILQTFRLSAKIALYQSSQSQAQNIETVAKTLVGMGSVTQQTAARAEQSAVASQELNAQAESLRSSVRRLDELISARKRAAA